MTSCEEWGRAAAAEEEGGHLPPPRSLPAPSAAPAPAGVRVYSSARAPAAAGSGGDRTGAASALVALVPSSLLHRLMWVEGKLSSAAAANGVSAEHRERSLSIAARAVGGRALQAGASARDCLNALRAMREDGGAAAALAEQAGEVPTYVSAALDSARFTF